MKVIDNVTAPHSREANKIRELNFDGYMSIVLIKLIDVWIWFGGRFLKNLEMILTRLLSMTKIDWKVALHLKSVLFIDHHSLFWFDLS